MIPPQTSLDLYEALKAAGIFRPEDDHEVIGFTVEARIGQPIMLRVDRRIYDKDGARTIVEVLSKFERFDCSLTVPKAKNV